MAVISDAALLRRTLQNIISNALRYTQEGGILVSVRRHADFDRIEIWDTGCGIPEDRTERVFEEFYRGVAVHDGGLSGYGLGLGLSIVQRMGDALGYKVGFRSRINRGTVFRIDMPLGTLQPKVAETAAAVVEEPRNYGLFEARVLLIENDSAVTAAMETMLQSWKCDVRSASGLAQAMDAVGDTLWTPDIIIADQHLDDGELGIVAVAELREYLLRATPALIVTADPDIASTSAARASGIEMMRKPVKPAQMRALLAHMLT
jgi:CheY-like chemotaxis protein